MRLGVALFAALMLASCLELRAQTIQLPSFSSFSVDTTVLVPDSGRAATANTKRAGSGQSTFGLFPRQRAIGLDRQAAGAQVTAKIHDPQEAEERLAPKRPGPSDAVGEVAQPARVAPSGGGAPRSVAEIKRERVAKSDARQREAFDLYEKGRQAEASGKPGVAAVYFRSASSRAVGTLKQEIDADIRALRAKSAAASRTARVEP